jgi:hypothetical protein
MRAAIALGFSFVGVSVAIAATAQHAPKHIADVTSLVSNASVFQDEVVTLTGVVRPGPDYAILFSNDSAFATGYPHSADYVELDDSREVYAQSEKYFGAIATITGKYHHDCLPSSRRLCFDYGGNGIITVTKIELFGYIDAAKFERDHHTPEKQLTTVFGGAAETLDLPLFVEKFVSATQRRDWLRFASLFVAKERAVAREALADRNSPDWWRAFAPEMRFYTSRMQPGFNYALSHTRGKQPTYFLCFCRASSCERVWPIAIDDIYRTNIRDPYVCRTVAPENGHWRLRRD